MGYVAGPFFVLLAYVNLLLPPRLFTLLRPHGAEDRGRFTICSKVVKYGGAFYLRIRSQLLCPAI